MNYILVDYENVSIKGLDGIEKLSAEDIVYIFYSDNTAHMSMDLVAKLGSATPKIYYIKTKAGKNALDFILSSELGYLIHEGSSECSYYIVSKDKGYEPLENHWKEIKVSVKIVDSINKISVKKSVKKEKSLDAKELHDLKCRVGQCLKGIDKTTQKKIVEIIINTKSKKAVQNSIKQLVKDTNDANSIYQKINKLIVDKK